MQNRESTEAEKEKEKEILAQLQHDWRNYGKKPPWINKVDATKPPVPQVENLNKQAAEQRTCRSQQDQDSIDDEEHYYDLGHYLHAV